MENCNLGAQGDVEKLRLPSIIYRHITRAGSEQDSFHYKILPGEYFSLYGQPNMAQADQQFNGRIRLALQ